MKQIINSQQQQVAGKEQNHFMKGRFTFRGGNKRRRQPQLHQHTRFSIFVLMVIGQAHFHHSAAVQNSVLVAARPITSKSLPWMTRRSKMRGGAVVPSSEHRLVQHNDTDRSTESSPSIEDSASLQQNIVEESESESTKETEETHSESNLSTTASIETSDDSKSGSEIKGELKNGESASTSEQHDDPKILMLIRILFLSYYASLGSLMPYLPVYYHSLGHGGQIIGLIGAVKPLTTFIVAPFWGIVSDKSHKPFTILKATFLISLIGQLLVAVRHEFRYLMFMVFVTALFNAPVKSLIDSMVMDHLKDQSHYGRLRLWGQMGFGLGSSGVGVLLSKSRGKVEGATSISPVLASLVAKLPPPLRFAIHQIDEFWHTLHGYKLLFLTYAALSIPTWIAIQASQRYDRLKEEAHRKEKTVTSSEVKKEEDATVEAVESDKEDASGRIMEGLSLLLHNGDALLFFFLVFVVGVSSGCIENFAYVRMREVGGSGKEMGLSRLVSSLAGAPMFWFSGPLTEALGADRVLVLSLMSYTMRFCIYALMRNPYHGLPAEALRGLTFAGFWSTATIYAHRISPEGLHATILMFLNAMYGGLGQSLGAIIGGKLQGKVGTVKTFLYGALADSCFVIGLVIYLSFRKESNFKNPKPISRETSKATELTTSKIIKEHSTSALKTNVAVPSEPTTTTLTTTNIVESEEDDIRQQQRQEQHKETKAAAATSI